MNKPPLPGTPPTHCIVCGEKGHDALTCTQVQIESGNRSGATRRTVQGIMDAVEKAVWALGWKGQTKPYVLLLARPGKLPSIKITVEIHEPAEA